MHIRFAPRAQQATCMPYLPPTITAPSRPTCNSTNSLFS